MNQLRLISSYLFVGWCLSLCGESLATPPNVVLILSDDQAWTDYGFMQHPQIETPNLDRLASQSLTFTRGYVPASLCRPSLATIISGLYPHQHGIVGNDPPAPANARNARGNIVQTHPDYLKIREQYVDHMRNTKTICKRLTPLGYACFQSGKWWEGHWSTGGFTEGMSHGDPGKGGRHGDDGLKIGREGLQPIEEFMDRCVQQSKPFLLWYAPMLPHTPHEPPARLLKQYLPIAPTQAIAKYWAMCEWFDESIGDLLLALDRRNLSQNTIVIYVTDNGWINLPEQSAYAPRSKRSQYDGGLRTPIMIRWPAKLKPQLNTQDLASSIDIVPTIMAACGLPADAELPGINLMDAPAVQQRKQIFGAVFEHDIASMDEPAESLMWRWTILERYKLIVPASRMEAQEHELFDLVTDPFEQRDLSRSQPNVVHELQATLDEWWQPKD